MKRKNQRGIALAVTLMVLLILVVVAMSIGSIGVFNLRHMSNYRDSETAYYAAKTGVVQAIDILRATRTWSSSSSTAVSGTLTNNATYKVGPVYTDSSYSSYCSTNNLEGSSAITRGDGIYVPAGHAYIIGTGICNSQTRRAATMLRGSNPPWNYALFGYDSLEVGGNGDVDGDVGTNTYDLSNTGSGTITGKQQTNAGISKPEVVDPTGGGGTSNITATCTIAPGAYGKIQLSSTKSVTLSAGNYSFTSISLAANASINISSGPVYIYVSGDIDLTGQGIVNSTANAANCIIYGTSTCTSVFPRGGSDAYYGIYAPYADIDFGGGGTLHGAAIGKTAVSSGNSSITYDSNLANMLFAGGSTYLDAITWQNVY